MGAKSADGPIILRHAKPADARELARVYVESWRETYAGLLPDNVLLDMSIERQRDLWRQQVETAGRAHGVIVAAIEGYGLAGLASFGPARDGGLGRNAGEVYALYVDPNHTGRGIGRALLRSAFRLLRERGHPSAVIWALAGNPARFFYEAEGGLEIATRPGRLGGAPITEVAFGWDNLSATLGGAQARPNS